jgi:glycosyltransferase involved in cell wall biosynthesis
MYKISVIIPVFNAENTLNRAIDSILNQNWEGNVTEDIEIVLCDDCSTDNSKKIIEQYSKKYSNINSLATEKNTGFPSMPRNIAIANANADYVMFMDNDDEYDKDMCQTLYEVIIQENVDVVTCNWCSVSKYGVEKVKLRLPDGYVVSNDSLQYFNSFDAIVANEFSIWNRIYNKNFIIKNNISFPSRIAEDTFFCIDVFLNMDKMAYLRDYHGLIKHVDNSSLSSTIEASHILNTIDSLMDLYGLFDSGIDFKKHPEFRLDFPRYIIPGDLIKIMFLKKTEDIKICIKKMYEYEDKVSFDNSLPVNSFYNAILKILNYLILNKHFTIATGFIKLSHVGIGLVKILKK